MENKDMLPTKTLSSENEQSEFSYPDWKDSLIDCGRIAAPESKISFYGGKFDGAPGEIGKLEKLVS